MTAKADYLRWLAERQPPALKRCSGTDCSPADAFGEPYEGEGVLCLASMLRDGRCVDCERRSPMVEDQLGLATDA